MKVCEINECCLCGRGLPRGALCYAAEYDFWWPYLAGHIEHSTDRLLSCTKCTPTLASARKLLGAKQAEVAANRIKDRDQMIASDHAHCERHRPKWWQFFRWDRGLWEQYVEGSAWLPAGSDESRDLKEYPIHRAVSA